MFVNHSKIQLISKYIKNLSNFSHTVYIYSLHENILILCWFNLYVPPALSLKSSYLLQGQRFYHSNHNNWLSNAQYTFQVLWNGCWIRQWVTVTLSDATINLIIIHLLELSLHYLINYQESLMTSWFCRAMPLFITFHLPILACPLFYMTILETLLPHTEKIGQ